MEESLLRFFLGGAIVSAFAVLGDLFRPKSFAGLFGAAPSVALATLGLTIAKEGDYYAATEARSMLAGAVALCIYSQVVCRLMMHRKLHALLVTSLAVFLWLAIAFGLYALFLR